MKMFVLVRTDLSMIQQAVQAGHGLGEYLVRGPKTEWDNGTLVYLGVKNLKALETWIWKLELKQIPHSIFREPDIGNEVTSVAIVGHDEEFKHLQTLKFS